MTTLPDNGWVAVVKRDCPTCELTEPALAMLQQAAGVTVYTQDDPTFPESVPHEYDKSLDISHGLKIETRKRTSTRTRTSVIRQGNVERIRKNWERR